MQFPKTIKELVEERIIFSETLLKALPDRNDFILFHENIKYCLRLLNKRDQKTITEEEEIDLKAVLLNLFLGTYKTVQNDDGLSLEASSNNKKIRKILEAFYVEEFKCDFPSQKVWERHLFICAPKDRESVMKREVNLIISRFRP